MSIDERVTGRQDESGEKKRILVFPISKESVEKTIEDVKSDASSVFYDTKEILGFRDPKLLKRLNSLATVSGSYQNDVLRGGILAYRIFLNSVENDSTRIPISNAVGKDIMEVGVSEKDFELPPIERIGKRETNFVDGFYRMFECLPEPEHIYQGAVLVYRAIKQVINDAQIERLSGTNFTP